MATWAVGDVQGCCDDLDRLLDTLAFDTARDTLWFTGDLVNRGPRSLDALRRVIDLGDSAITVLGNHDLHALAVAGGVRRTRGRDTLDDFLSAPDRDRLVDWLRRRPLAHYDKALDTLLVHAGLPPQWTAKDAMAAASEVEAPLRGDDWIGFVDTLFGDPPKRWRKRLKGKKRARFIATALTRMRYCDAEGRIDLESKGRPGTEPPDLYPWFDAPGRKSTGTRIVFGHWATLGFLSRKNLLALDTGCVWGGALTAVRLDRRAEPVQVDCRRHRSPGR